MIMWFITLQQAMRLLTHQPQRHKGDVVFNSKNLSDWKGFFGFVY
jgi:hypothetical protein